MIDNINISKINVQFGGNNEPKDEKLIKLLKSAYSGKLLVRIALIKEENIKPFSNFKPDISNNFSEYFESLEKEGNPPPLHVYPENDYFVMSDDYNSYFLYKEKGYSKIMCILLGDSASKGIIESSDPFQLPPLTATII